MLTIRLPDPRMRGADVPDTGGMHPGQRPARGGLASWLLVACGVLLVGAGLVAWLTQAPPTPPLEASATRSTQSGSPVAPPPQVVTGVAAPARQQRPPAEAGAPERLVVPDLAIDAPVIPVAAPDGVLTPPDDPQTVGWWADGARPGAARGSALVTGHTVHDGGGAMDDLEQLDAGDPVAMVTDRGSIDYRVERVVVLGKGELAERAQVLFDQDVPGRLVLITCEDWNGVEYLGNVVVTAAPV